jgi:hypothetical protein
LLSECYREQRRADDWRGAVGATILANVHRKPGSRVQQPEDFFPSLKREIVTASGPAQTPEQQFAMFKAMFADRIKS